MKFISLSMIIKFQIQTFNPTWLLSTLFICGASLDGQIFRKQQSVRNPSNPTECQSSEYVSSCNIWLCCIEYAYKYLKKVQSLIQNLKGLPMWQKQFKNSLLVDLRKYSKHRHLSSSLSDGLLFISEDNAIICYNAAFFFFSSNLTCFWLFVYISLLTFSHVFKHMYTNLCRDASYNHLSGSLPPWVITVSQLYVSFFSFFILVAHVVLLYQVWVRVSILYCYRMWLE